MKIINEQTYLDPIEVCATLGISQSTLKNWRNEGRIQYMQISDRKFLYLKSSVNNFIREAIERGNSNKTLLKEVERDNRDNRDNRDERKLL